VVASLTSRAFVNTIRNDVSGPRGKAGKDMVERVVERGREPEPKEILYDLSLKWRAEYRRQREVGQVVIRGRDISWEQNRQGLIKHYLHPLNWDELAVPYWLVFIHEIGNHSGRHRHQGGLGLFVLEGKGYTVVDGTRYDWEKGDLVILPMKPDGCEHQHFNLEPDKASQWLALIFTPYFDAVGNDLEQRVEAPDWKAGKPASPHVA